MTAKEWDQVQSILDCALGREVESRAAFLDAACPDSELRLQVESFLRSYEQMGSFLEPPGQLTIKELPTFKAGQMAGPYEISHELGRGGMGVVYQAKHISLLRKVALKFPALDVAIHPTALARFSREARAASALNHPNICTIYEVGECEGLPFIAMEFVEGQPLDHVIPPCGLDDKIAASYGIHIADALAHAHERGVIHRDLKPANVMVTPAGSVKVLDFGLAKQSISEPALDETLTHHGTLLGTLAYMSPEALRGETVDARSDIWSLGLLLYQSVAGHLPFEGKTGLERSAAILHETTPRLPRPSKLRRIVAHCLEKMPEARYQNAAELRCDLEKCYAPASGNLIWLSTRRFVPALAVLLIGAFCTLWVRNLGLLPGRAQLPDKRMVAVLPYKNTLGTAEGQALCDGFQETVAMLLSELEKSHKYLRVTPLDEIRKRKVDNESNAAPVLGANLILTGNVEQVRDGTMITTILKDATSSRELGRRAKVLGNGKGASFQEEAAQIAASLLGLEMGVADNAVVTAGGSSQENAYESYLKGRGYLDRYDLPGNLELSVQRFRSAISADPGFALAYAGLADAYCRKYRDTKDTQWLERAEELGRRAVEIDSKIALAHITLGTVFLESGETDAAVTEFRSALQVNPVAVAAYRGLAASFEQSGRTKQAGDIYLKAAQMRPNDWVTLTWLGTFYFKQGRLREAEPIFTRIAELLPDSSMSYANLGVLHAATNQSDKAFGDYQKSLANGPTALAYVGLAGLYFDQRNFIRAAALNEKAVELTGDTSYTALGNLAQAYQWTPSLAARAPKVYRRAIAVTDRVLATNSKDAFALSCRAVYEAQIGNRPDAMGDIEKALGFAPHDIRIAVHAAVVYERLGDRLRALQAAHRALSDGGAVDSLMHEPDLDSLQKDLRSQKFKAMTVATP